MSMKQIHLRGRCISDCIRIRGKSMFIYKYVEENKTEREGERKRERETRQIDALLRWRLLSSCVRRCREYSNDDRQTCAQCLCMYVCIDQNCGVTIGEGEEEEANVSLLFLLSLSKHITRKEERKPVYGQIFLSPPLLRRREERERERKVKVI